MNTSPESNSTPPPRTRLPHRPLSARTRHQLGLSTLEMLIAATITVVGVGMLTLSVTGNLREQTEQGQSSNAKNSLRRIVDNLNTQVQQGSMVAIRNADNTRANILFIDEANALNVSSSTNFSNADSLNFSSGHGSFKAGDEALMVNTNGDAVLFTITQDASSTDALRALQHTSCPNTIQYTPGTRVFKANSFAFALGNRINSNLTPDSLYQQHNNGAWEEVAYNLKTFNLRYGYTATDGTTRENLSQTNANARADMLANVVNQDNREFRLSSLSLQMAQGAMIERAYNASVPLQTTRLKVNTIKQCGRVIVDRGTPAGALRVVITAPGTFTPAVTVDGPGFGQTINRTTPDTTPWNRLPSGSYSATAPEANAGNTTWVPVISGAPANITSWSGSTILVKYNPALAPLTINVSGLPADTRAPVTLTATSTSCVSWAPCLVDPSTPDAPTTFDQGTSRHYGVNPSMSLNLAPGQYGFGAGAVVASDGKTYAPTSTPPASVTMTSRQPQVVNLAYAPVTGGLLVQFYGAPGGTLNATVRGPNNYQSPLTLANGGSQTYPTAVPGVYTVTGTNQSGVLLPAQTGVVYPNGRSTIVMRDPVGQYTCPNGTKANTPSQCPICPDGSLVGPTNTCADPKSQPHCPDGRLMPATGVCGCPDGSPSSAAGTCPAPPAAEVERENDCPGGGRVMCVDGPNDRPIGSTVVIEYNGQQVTIDRSMAYGDPITMPDGNTYSVEQLLSNNPTVEGDLGPVVGGAYYADCRDASCEGTRPTIPDAPGYEPPTTEPSEGSGGYKDPSPPEPSAGAPEAPAPDPTPPETTPPPHFNPRGPYPSP